MKDYLQAVVLVACLNVLIAIPKNNSTVVKLRKTAQEECEEKAKSKLDNCRENCESSTCLEDCYETFKDDMDLCMKKRLNRQHRFASLSNPTFMPNSNPGSTLTSATACSLVYNNLVYVFGGTGHETAVKKVDAENHLIEIGTLNHMFSKGSCGATEQNIFLCFDMYSSNTTCFESEHPASVFHEIKNSFYHHGQASLSSTSNELLAVGYMGRAAQKSEVYKIETDNWVTVSKDLV